jgi:16S rRNA (guanine527-N7)-methyltransferase
MELALANVEVVASRIEDYHPDQTFHVIVSRAFSELADFARLASHLLGPNGELVAMKGVVPHEELAAMTNQFQVRLDNLRVPGLEAQRCLVRLRLAE